MKRVLPCLVALVPLGCRAPFDIDKYLVADGTGDTAGESGTDDDSDTDSTDESETDTSDTGDTTDETDTSDTNDPCPLDIDGVCIELRTILDIGVPPYDIAVGDFTFDGRDDLLVSGSPVTLYAGEADAQFAQGVTMDEIHAVGLAAGDFDGDLMLDFAAIGDDTVTFQSSLGGGAFNQTDSVQGGGQDGVFGDLDGDGDLDLAVNGPKLQVFLQSSGWQLSADLAEVGVGIALGRLDDDDRLDIGLALPSDGVGMFLNDGTGGIAVQYQAIVSSPADVATIDRDGNGGMELIVVGGGGSGYASIYELQRGPAISEVESIAVGGTPRAVAVGDVNGDALDDIAIANSSSHDVSVVLGGGGSTTEFRIPAQDDGDMPESIAIADLDGNQRGEIIVGMLGSNRVLVFGGVEP